MLGDLLQKKPNSKRVEQFMASQISLRLESLRIDAQIQKSFEAINNRLQNRLNNMHKYLENFDFEN
jgi:hypothetical protein